MTGRLKNFDPKIQLLSLCALIFFSAALSGDESQSLKRIHAHLLIDDAVSASLEANEALKRDPYNSSVHEAHIKALAHAGDEKQMCRAFAQYNSFFPCDPREQRDLYEAMAWGIISAGSHSTSPIIRLSALLAAFFGEDAKSVKQLRLACRDSNSAVRAAAVQLMSHLHDAPLCDEMMRLFEQEKVWKVRQEVIKAIGKMKIRRGREKLLAIVANPHSLAEEKTAAIGALVNLFDTIAEAEIESLARNDRAGLRLLACEVITHLQTSLPLPSNAIDLLLFLASDSSSEVRAAALRALGLLNVDRPSIIELAKKSCADPSVEVAITAAWLLSIREPPSARAAFTPWLKHELPEVRLQAAAALTATGSHAVGYIQEAFYAGVDPFVRVNLALGLIGQGVYLDDVCDALYIELMKGSKRWMRKDLGSFPALVPLIPRYSEGVSGSLEEINQLTRLEILNLLAIVKYPRAQEAIELFLQQKKWGISGLATAVLLTEGDGDVLALIENVIEEAPLPIKAQAALILALWGRGERAIALLEQSYLTADRDTKELILEGIGRIGAISSLPFLLKRFQEPQQTLRLMAAAAVLQCLYH